MRTARKKARSTRDPWLTVPQAARELGIANATVLQRALLNELETTTIAGRTFISRESVEKAKGAA